MIIFSKPVTDKTQYDKEMNDVFGIESWSKYKNERNRDQILKMIDYDSIKGQHLQTLNDLTERNHLKIHQAIWMNG